MSSFLVIEPGGNLLNLFFFKQYDYLKGRYRVNGPLQKLLKAPVRRKGKT